MDKPLIYSALSRCMAEVGAIGKDKVNEQQRFKYRGIDDVMNALQPVFVNNKVFIVPEVLEERREERTSSRGGNLIYTVLKIKYTFYAEDGSHISAVVIGEGMDSGDKSANKAQAIAMKYACFQVLCIPTEEMKDPDAETPEPSTPKANKEHKSTEKTSTKVNFINEQQRKDLVELLNGLFGKHEAPKKLKELTGYSSTAIIPETEFDKVWNLIVNDENDLPPWEK